MRCCVIYFKNELVWTFAQITPSGTLPQSVMSTREINFFDKTWIYFNCTDWWPLKLNVCFSNSRSYSGGHPPPDVFYSAGHLGWCTLNLSALCHAFLVQWRVCYNKCMQCQCANLSSMTFNFYYLLRFHPFCFRGCTQVLDGGITLSVTCTPSTQATAKSIWHLFSRLCLDNQAYGQTRHMSGHSDLGTVRACYIVWQWLPTYTCQQVN
jgi:hypothetical protein